MNKPAVLHASVIKVTENKLELSNDLLAIEEPLEIRIGYGKNTERFQKSISVTMRTPGHDFELALGFLFTEGIINSKKQIASIKYCNSVDIKENTQNIVRVELLESVDFDFTKLQRNFYTTSSCGVCGKASIDAIKTVCSILNKETEVSVNQLIIKQLPDKLRSKQNVFEYTGGLHACALFDISGNLEIIREDVGRHNALDKLIGACFSKNESASIFSNKILLLSGRASFELIQKAAMAGIQVVCAIGAPSSLAVQTAQEFNITLIGFLRQNRFNIYSHSCRIVNS